MLDVDTITPPLADNISDLESSTVSADNPFLSQRPLDAQDVDTISTPRVEDNSPQESSTVSMDNPFLRQRPLDAQDAVPPSLVDDSSGLENSHASANPFLSHSPLYPREVEVTGEKEGRLQEQETTLSQINDGKTCKKLINVSSFNCNNYLKKNISG